MSLSSDLAEALSVPNVIRGSKAPKGFEPGVQYVSGIPDVIVTPDVVEAETDAEYEAIVKSMGVPLPAGARLVLDKAWFNTNAWTRDDPDQENAVTKPCWRYAFKVVYDVASMPDPDWDVMLKRVAKRRRTREQDRAAAKGASGLSMPVVLGDLQTGKSDRLGGTQELLERLDVALADVVKRVRQVKPAQILLLDAGDILEGFESAPNAARTNDLSQTQQITLARRILWHWIETLAPLAGDVVVAGVPSNHCRVRAGKLTLGDPLDDYGVMNVAACADMAATNPAVFGHVRFALPEPHEEALAIELAGGKVLGLAHGHQKGGPEQFRAYLADQALGRTPVGQADIIVFGHFHQLRVQTVGDDRWIFVAPTMDNGSSWHTNIKGDSSRPGVLTFLVDEGGWHGLHVAWAG